MKDELNNEDEIEDIDGISIVQFYSDEINYHMEAIKDIEEQLKYLQSNGATKAPVPFNYDTCGINLMDDYEDDIIYIYEEEEEDVTEEED